jgi:heptaprenyl diphosphate synthase
MASTLLANDIRGYRELSPDRKLYLIAFLTALSGILAVADSFLPKPIPFAKLGLANLVTVYLVAEKRYGLAFQTAVYRTIAAGFVLGTFLSYTYLLSLSSSLASVGMMALLSRTAGKRMSEAGISVWGSFASALAQGAVVGIFYGFDRGLLLMVSLFLLIGAVTGFLIGLGVRSYRRAEAEN